MSIITGDCDFVIKQNNQTTYDIPYKYEVLHTRLRCCSASIITSVYAKCQTVVTGWMLLQDPSLRNWAARPPDVHAIV